MRNTLANLVLVFAVAFILSIWASPARAEQGGLSDQDDVHLAAHIGMSYAINTFTYGIATRAFRFERNDALVFSAASTLIIGAMWKLLESGAATNPNFGQDFKTSMVRNAAGVALSAGTVLMFKF